MCEILVINLNISMRCTKYKYNKELIQFGTIDNYICMSYVLNLDYMPCNVCRDICLFRYWLFCKIVLYKLNKLQYKKKVLNY